LGLPYFYYTFFSVCPQKRGNFIMIVRLQLISNANLPVGFGLQNYAENLNAEISYTINLLNNVLALKKDNNLLFICSDLIKERDRMVMKSRTLKGLIKPQSRISLVKGIHIQFVRFQIKLNGLPDVF